MTPSSVNILIERKSSQSQSQPSWRSQVAVETLVAINQVCLDDKNKNYYRFKSTQIYSLHSLVNIVRLLLVTDDVKQGIYNNSMKSISVCDHPHIFEDNNCFIISSFYWRLRSRAVIAAVSLKGECENFPDSMLDTYVAAVDLN